MGDRPLPVHAVAREAAAHLVVDAALGHCAQGVLRHLERVGVARGAVAAQQELDRVGARKLRRAAEAAVLGVEGIGELRGRLLEGLAREGVLGAPRGCMRARADASRSFCSRISAAFSS